MSDGNEKLYDFVGRSDATGLYCADVSMTVQADAADADINNIVRRYHLLGTVPQSLRLPEYADYEDVFDFHSAQLALLDAQQTFMTIPAEIRSQFNNDPGEFLHFASDPNNIDALRDLGLAKPKPIDIIPVPKVDPE